MRITDLLLVAPPFGGSVAAPDFVEADVSVVLMGGVSIVTASCFLAAPVYYHWYLDGQYLGMTTLAERSFRLVAGDQVQLIVLATRLADFDPYANAPAGYPARKTVWWIRSLDPSAAWYRVDQQQPDSSWLPVARLAADSKTWGYCWLSGRLADLTAAAFRIVPLDALGREGSPLVFPPEMIVRTPDSPAFTISFNPTNQLLTLSAA